MRKRNYNQLVRIDAMKKFLEVTDTSFSIGKFKLFFAELDDNNKQKANGDYYLDILDFVSLKNIVDSEEIAEISKQKAASGDLYSPIWQVEGGKRFPDKIVAKRLKLLPSKKANHVMIQYEIGEGSEGKTGGFVFKGRAQKFIGIPIDIEMLRKNLAYLETAYRGYESSYIGIKHNMGGIYNLDEIQKNLNSLEKTLNNYKIFYSKTEKTPEIEENLESLKISYSEYKDFYFKVKEILSQKRKNEEITKTLKNNEYLTKSLTISDSSYNIDRIKLTFLEKNNDGSDKEKIEVLVDVLNYLSLNSILSNPNLLTFLKKKAESDKDFVLFETAGGKPSKKTPRLDGKPFAWRIRLQPHEKNLIRLVAQVGTGIDGKNGGVVYENTEREVSLIFELSELRAFIENGKMSLQSYYNAYGNEKYFLETKKRVRDEKDKFWKKEETEKVS